METPIEGQNTSRRPKKWLDQVRATRQLKDCSVSTEKAYAAWIKRYMLFHHTRHPEDMGVPEIEASRSVTDLAVDLQVAVPTQNQALNALLFLYREVLKKDLARPIDALCAKRRKRVLRVPTTAQVRRVIGHLSGMCCTAAAHLHLRCLWSLRQPFASRRRRDEEAQMASAGVRIWVRDLDFARGQRCAEKAAKAAASLPPRPRGCHAAGSATRPGR